MFHLYQPDHIEWPVSVDLPSKNGTKKTYTFTAHFFVLDQDDCQDLQDQHNQMLVTMRRRLEVLQGYGKEEATVTEELPCSYEDLADAVLCGWGPEVVDKEGEPIEFTKTSKAQLYRIQGAAAATFQAWLDSLGRPSEKGAAKAGDSAKKLIDAARFIAAAAKGEPKDDGKDAADAAAIFGLVVEEPDEEPDSFGILPENVDALNWFLLMQTQWTPGMNGPVGMKYDVFLQWAKEEGVKRLDRVWLLGDLRMMEREFLGSLYSEAGSR